MKNPYLACYGLVMKVQYMDRILFVNKILVERVEG